MGKVPPNENVQFTSCPSSVIGPGVAVACWLNNNASGSSIASCEVVVFHVSINQLEPPSKPPDASAGCKANTYSPSAVAAWCCVMMDTGDEVGCMLVGGGVTNAAESAPTETFTNTGLTHSINRVVAYFMRYCKYGVSSGIDVSEWLPGG